MNVYDAIMKAADSIPYGYRMTRAGRLDAFMGGWPIILGSIARIAVPRPKGRVATSFSPTPILPKLWAKRT